MYRGIRFHSHDKLPETERNVQVFIYLAVFPQEDKTIKELPTDVQLLKSSAQKYELNRQMMELCASVAIECDKFNSKVNFECYKCVPLDGKPLFINNLDTDMGTPSPCESTKHIKAKEISVNGVLYYIDDMGDIYQRLDNINNDEEDTFEKIYDQDIIDYIKSSII